MPQKLLKKIKKLRILKEQKTLKNLCFNSQLEILGYLDLNSFTAISLDLTVCRVTIVAF